MTLSLDNLAALYFLQKDYAKAEPLFKRLLAICLKVYGPNHTNVAITLEILASLSRKTNRIEEAQKLAEQAARIRTIKREEGTTSR